MSEERDALQILLDGGAGDCDDWCGRGSPCFKCKVKDGVGSLRQQLSEAKAKLAASEEKYKEVLKGHRYLQESRDEVQAKLTALEAENTQLKEDRKILGREYDGKRLACRKLFEEVATLERSLGRAVKALKRIIAEEKSQIPQDGMTCQVIKIAEDFLSTLPLPTEARAKEVPLCENCNEFEAYHPHGFCPKQPENGGVFKFKAPSQSKEGRPCENCRGRREVETVVEGGHRFTLPCPRCKPAPPTPAVVDKLCEECGGSERVPGWTGYIPCPKCKPAPKEPSR